MARLCEFRFLTAPGHGEQAQLTQPSPLSPCTLGLFECMAFLEPVEPHEPDPNLN